MKLSSSQLDIILTTFLKEFVDSLGLTTLTIINSSSTHKLLSHLFKYSIVQSLKRPGLDPKLLDNQITIYL